MGRDRVNPLLMAARENTHQYYQQLDRFLLIIVYTFDHDNTNWISITVVIVVVLGFYVSPTSKVIRRRDLALKSHPKDWGARDRTHDPWIRRQVA